MNILQIVRQYLPGTGGMETYVSSLCRELSRRGHRSDVATLDRLFHAPAGSGQLQAYEHIQGTDVIRLPFAGTARYFLAPAVLKLVPRYDLIHIHGVDFFADLLGTCKPRHGKPLVLSTHGGFFHTRWLPALKQAYFHSVTRMTLRGVDRIIASSPQDEQLFRHISSHVTLVENGIDYERYSSLAGAPEGDTLLFVGRISRNKRVDRLLPALAELRKSRPGARLVVAGPDWEGLQAELERQAAGLGLGGAVSFTGTLTDEQLHRQLSAARLFVSASEYEAFGLSTVEAMASGTVPVVNHIQAFADIIDDGASGFLTDFSRPALAAESLRRALELSDEQQAAMGGQARRAASRYDWREVAGKITGIYEEVLAAHGPAGCRPAKRCPPGSGPFG